MSDFRDDPAFLRDEANRQAALATGAMRAFDEASEQNEALRQQLRGAVAEIERLRGLVCTCEYLIDFEDGSPPQHRPDCPAIPSGGQ